MRISTKGRGIIRAQQGAVARPNPKENYKLPEDQRYQAQTRGMKDFAIEWYKDVLNSLSINLKLMNLTLLTLLTKLTGQNM